MTIWVVALEDPQASEARSEDQAASEQAASEQAASEQAEPFDSPPSPLPILLVTGLLWGGLEALVLHGALHPPWVWLLAGALTTMPAGALGLAAWGLLMLLWRRKALRSRIGSAWSAATDRSAEDREPIVKLHAQLSAGVLAVGGVAAACWFVLSRLIVLQAQDLALHLAIFTTVSLVIGVLFAVPFGVRILTPAWRALDRRMPLPQPPQAGVRYLLFVVLPMLG